MDPNDWTLAGNARTNPSNNFFETTDSELRILKISSGETMHINPNGNVDIGIHNSDAKLQVSSEGWNLSIRSTKGKELIDVETGTRALRNFM